ncbi:MAG TPA: ABC transporter permease [Vicinamibacterales bacterium]|nr:ABC transporter permease [Vicinamibacterales bacterium]
MNANWRRGWLRLRNVFGSARVERELAREVASHLELLEQEFLRRGLPPQDARTAARRAFGGVEQVKERHREERSIMWLDDARRDLQYATRTLRRTPGFTTIAIATLALGIGAATAIFSLADAALLHPLPFPDADRLVTVNEIVPFIGDRPIRVTAPDLLDYEQQTHNFSAVAGWIGISFELSGVGQSETIQAARVTPSLFAALQAQPSLGRVFTDDEDRKDVPVCIVSDGLWQRWFGADPHVLGRVAILDRKPYKVIGVMPRGFAFPLEGTAGVRTADLWVPMSLTPAERQARLDNWSYNALARMRPGVTIAQASADLESVARHIVSELAPLPNGTRVTFSAVARPLAPQVSGPLRPLVTTLLGAVACLLLIACVNVANLLLARGAHREREFAIRVALGAGRRRVFQQLVLETLLIAAVAALAGSLLAWWSVRTFSYVIPARLAALAQAPFNWQVLLFTVGITIAVTVLVGIVPGIGAIRRVRGNAMNERGAASGNVDRRRLRSTLVVVEVALALVLLVGAGLLGRSFSDLLRTYPGFDPEGAAAGSIGLPETAYPDTAREQQTWRALLDRLRALPGTTVAGVGTSLPLNGRRNERVFTPADSTAPPNTSLDISAMTTVDGQYLQAIGASLVRGRYFTAHDDAHAAPVAIVTESVWRQYWNGQDPIGKRLKWGGRDSSQPWLTVVGVVKDVKQDGLDTPAGPQIYVRSDQIASSVPAEYRAQHLRSMFGVVRGRGSADRLAADLRQAVRAVDPRLSVAHLEPLADTLATSASPERFNLLLMLAFAAAALALAAIGVYGVMAYSVTQRRQEIGLRMALGADAGTLVRMILGRGLLLALVGIALGTAGAIVTTPALRSLLFGVQPLDPPTFGTAALLLFVVAALATYIPARRASQVDPQIALRSE